VDLLILPVIVGSLPIVLQNKKVLHKKRCIHLFCAGEDYKFARVGVREHGQNECEGEVKLLNFNMAL